MNLKEELLKYYEKHDWVVPPRFSEYSDEKISMLKYYLMANEHDDVDAMYYLGG